MVGSCFAHACAGQAELCSGRFRNRADLLICTTYVGTVVGSVIGSLSIRGTLMCVGHSMSVPM
jgi:hypothetical protein